MTLGFKQRNMIFARDIQVMEEGKQLAKGMKHSLGYCVHFVKFNSLVYYK